MKARGFLLFSFAFSYVLSSPEIDRLSKSGDSKITRISRSASGLATGDSIAIPGAKSYDLKNGEDGDVKQKETVRFPSFAQNLLLMQEEDRDLSKRNRMGFTGMRGKKKILISDVPPAVFGQSRCCDFSLENKRALMGHYNELFGGKRTPFAFHGMRGKKSEGNEESWFEPEFDVPGKRFYDDNRDIIGLDYLEPAVERREDEIFGEGSTIMNKRSPYPLQGIRREKTSAYDLKRAKGFLGMRGKKALEIWNSDIYKRTPQSAFFGMKGKRTQSRFGTMENKPSLAYSNYPQEPTGSDNEANSFLDHLERTDSSRTKSRRGSAWIHNEKKTKNVFFDIEGEKSNTKSSSPNYISAED